MRLRLRQWKWSHIHSTVGGGVLGAASPLYLSPSQEGYRGFVPVRDREETSRKQEGYRGFVPVRFRNESTLPGARHSHFRA